jgi:hypothetical protein
MSTNKKGASGTLKVFIVNVEDDRIEYFLYHDFTKGVLEHKRPKGCKYRFDKFKIGNSYEIYTEKKVNQWHWYFIDHMQIANPPRLADKLEAELKKLDDN